MERSNGKWRWIQATALQVEAMRTIYRKEPASTAAGLARRFGVPIADAIAAVMGGWFGMDSLTSRGRAKNLARARSLLAEEGLLGPSRFVVEADLCGHSLERAIAKRLRDIEKKRPRYVSRRALRFEEHLKTYVPLVGASVRAARNRRIRGGKRATPAVP